MYQRLGKSAYKTDLSNTHALMRHLGDPQTQFKSVHVAGTNGKGSVSHMLASVFQEAGYKVGLYTSPHLKDFRERIKINGAMIPKAEVTSFIDANKTFFEKHSLSFFEMTVGLAFHYFKAENVDIAIVEVGLGGRLDSTNVIMPEVSVITNIGFDHTEFLGGRLSDIAREKAGIIKPNIPVVIGEVVKETKNVFYDLAKQANAKIYRVDDKVKLLFTTDLKGHYQKKNLKTALLTFEVLSEKGWELPQAIIKTGLNKVVANTGLQGRWQILNQKPMVVCDAAHNKAGLKLVLKQVLEQNYKQLHIVLGTVNDKDLNTILPLFPKEAQYYFCKPDIPRGLNPEILQETAAVFALKGQCFSSVLAAYKAALKSANPSDFIFVGGSTFVVAEVI